MSEFQFVFFKLPLEDVSPVSSKARRVGRADGTASASLIKCCLYGRDEVSLTHPLLEPYLFSTAADLKGAALVFCQ